MVEATCSRPSAAPTAAQCAISGRVDRRAVNTRYQSGGLPVQHAVKRAGAIWHRRWAFDAGVRKMRHEIEVEGKLLGGEPFIQREHKVPLAGRDEIIRVLDAGGDGGKFRRRADAYIGRARLPVLRAKRGCRPTSGIATRLDARRHRRRQLTARRLDADYHENSTHIGGFSAVSRLSRRMYMLPPPVGMR